MLQRLDVPTSHQTSSSLLISRPKLILHANLERNMNNPPTLHIPLPFRTFSVSVHRLKRSHRSHREQQVHRFCVEGYFFTGSCQKGTRTCMLAGFSKIDLEYILYIQSNYLQSRHGRTRNPESTAYELLSLCLSPCQPCLALGSYIKDFGAKDHTI